MILGDLAELHLASDDALFLDFDGTLADIGPDPDAVWLDPETADAIATIADRIGGAVALVSGRDIRDLARRTPTAVWRAGGHGLEIVPPEGTLPPAPAPLDDDVLGPLRACANAHPGVRLELKGPVAALHFRADPEAEAACLAAAELAAGRAADLVMQVGKMVVEVKPVTAHKGRALKGLASAAPFAGRRPVMLGDDTTDEDAIAAAQALGGLGVKVGPGESSAHLRTPDPAAVRAWLVREAAALEARAAG